MKSIRITNCKDGDILSEDVFNDYGVILAAKDTMLNEYVKLKLIDYHICEVKIYKSMKDKNDYSKFEKQYKEYIVQIRELLKSVTIGVVNDIEKVTLYLTEQIYKNISEIDYILHCLHTVRHKDEYTYTPVLTQHFIRC